MKKMYNEFLRQTKTTGIVGCVIMVLLSCFVAIGTNVSEYIYSKDNENYDALYEFVFNDIGYLYVAIIMIFALVMTVSVLSFLNKRNSSDFYHCIPAKRGTTYISIALSVLSWIFIIALLGCGLLGALCGILKFVQIDFSEILKILIYTIEAGIFVEAVMMLSMSISGSLASDMFAALIIVIVPRLLIGFMIQTSTMTAASDIFIPTDDIISYMLGINVITSMVTNTMFHFYAEVASEIVTCVGTIVESVVYLAIGYVAFVKRKSENAGISSISTSVQSILRIGLTLVLCTIGNYNIIYAIEYNDESMYVFSVLVYVGAVVVYFVYELITTRSTKAVGASLKQFPIVIILALAMLFTARGCIKIAKNYYADAEKIDCITISDGFSPMTSFLLDADQNSIEVEDTEIIKIIADSYNDRELIENDYYNYDFITVRFKDSPLGHTRSIYVSKEKYEKILEHVFENRDTKNDVYPEYKSKKHMLYAYSATTSRLTKEDMENLYGIYKSEIERSNNYSKVAIYGESCSYVTIVLEEKENSKEVAYAPISLYTPESINYMKTILQWTKESFSEFCEYMESDDTFNDIYASVYMSMLNSDDKVITANVDYTELRQSECGELFNIISNYSPDGDAAGKNPLVISAEMTKEYYNEQNNYWNSEAEECFDIYNLSDEDYAKVLKFIEESF